MVSGPILNVPSYHERPKPALANFSRAFFCTCNVSVPKVAIQATGGFDEQFHLYGWENTELGVRLREHGMRAKFAWDAYIWHVKPPSDVTLESELRKTMEKARMAVRFVRKNGSARVRSATGAHPANLLRAKALERMLPGSPASRRTSGFPRRCGESPALSCSTACIRSNSRARWIVPGKALLYCAGGGAGDSLMASVVARALRSRYARGCAYAAAHREVLERVPDLDRVLIDEASVSENDVCREHFSGKVRRCDCDLGYAAHGARTADCAHSGSRGAGAAALFLAFHQTRRRAQ